ncbi:MAG TPA: MBL fold metallo-hydrolase [bacterium]|nr:MBL fold metallo-hydrolase [bacterium]
MVEVKVLIKGYTSADSLKSSDIETTCPTITLIKDGSNIIVVDPGVLESQDLLLNKLAEEGLKINDVNYVFLTHSHPDHHMNAGMFPKAKKLEFYGLWDGNRCLEWDQNFTDDIEIIKTPGHSSDSLTFLVKTDLGNVAICGDVFWKENYPEDDPYANEKDKLAESRKKVLEIADYIIPGHGDIYKVNK